MIIKLSDYVLESEISDSEVFDIETEQAIAEIEVTQAICEAYFKQAEMVIMEAKSSESTSSQKSSKSAVKTRADANTALDKAIYQNKTMSTGEKIFWNIGKFIGKVVAWFSRTWTRFMGYVASKRVDKFIKRMESMTDEEKKNFKARFEDSQVRAINAKDIQLKFTKIFGQLGDFADGAYKAMNDVQSEIAKNVGNMVAGAGSDNDAGAMIAGLGHFLKMFIGDGVTLYSLNTPQPILMSVIMAKIFTTMTKFMQDQHVFMGKLIEKLGKLVMPDLTGITPERLKDVPELTKRAKRLRGMPKIVGTALVNALGEVEKKRGQGDAVKAKYVDIGWEQTLNFIKDCKQKCDSKEVKNIRKTIDKATFLNKTSDLISGQHVDQGVLDFAKVMFSMYKEIYSVTLMAMSNGMRYLGTMTKELERNLHFDHSTQDDAEAAPEQPEVPEANGGEG